MSRVVTMAVGRRPYCASTAITAFRLNHPVVFKHDLTLVFWAPREVSVLPETVLPDRVMDLPGASKAAANDAPVQAYFDEHGEWPDYWFWFDDDTIPCQGLIAKMEAVLVARPDIGLLGAWNDGSQTQRGHIEDVPVPPRVEQIQFGDDFNVGGAACAVPRSTIELLGLMDKGLEGTEDHEYTMRVRRAGLQSAIARSIYAVCVFDDGIDPTYRQLKVEQFQTGLRQLGLDPLTHVKGF